MARTAEKELGQGPTVVINNASALWWKPIEQTPMERYDLINSINARGTFAVTRACLPYMREARWGHVITQSPPIVLDKMAGMTAYNMSKFGMTLVALGVAQEYVVVVVLLSRRAVSPHHRSSHRTSTAPDIPASSLRTVSHATPRHAPTSLRADKHVTDSLRSNSHVAHDVD